MQQEIRRMRYDRELGLEAYRLQGIDQPFPNHFHDYYVIGLLESGTRRLQCRGRDYLVERGDVLLFQPGDHHGCVQSEGELLDYRGMNLSKQVMLELAGAVTGERLLPGFSQNVIRDGELACYLRPLHQMVMEGYQGIEKEETLLLLFSLLMERYGQPYEICIPECRAEIEGACAFLRAHYDRPVSLDQLCAQVGLSKSTLLRAFTREKGVTPYRYLEAIRIGRAKELLEQGVSPAETAQRTGFSDQSHFTRYFRRFLGLSPGSYQAMFRDRAGEEGGHGAE